MAQINQLFQAALGLSEPSQVVRTDVDATAAGQSGVTLLLEAVLMALAEMHPGLAELRFRARCRTGPASHRHPAGCAHAHP
jgi:hypothetical protein